jgi:hypothetical protein
MSNYIVNLTSLHATIEKCHSKAPNYSIEIVQACQTRLGIRATLRVENIEGATLKNSTY